MYGVPVAAARERLPGRGVTPGADLDRQADTRASFGRPEGASVDRTVRARRRGRPPEPNEDGSLAEAGGAIERAPAGDSAALRRIVIVANRGPNDFVWLAERGTWEARAASGGLVSMLAPLARQPGVAWFCCVSEPPDAEQARDGLFTTAAEQTAPRLHVIPVPLPAATYHAYYGQISNEVLWMLQHHVVGVGGYHSLDARRHAAWEHGYLAANARIAEAVAAWAPTDSAYLIQDYHLYPLPALLRQRAPAARMLHFTHIPFPEPAVLRLLPRAWRDGILRGMLGADVVGVQTEGDARAFLDCCRDLLRAEVDTTRGRVEAPDGREVAVRAFPASTDPVAVRRLMRSARVAAARARLAGNPERLTVIRVDRLDPSKNQLIGFRAFGRLLELRPELRPRLRFLAFLVPSRTDLGIYRAYRDAVYGLIEEINQRFERDCGGPPIQVFYTHDREQALAAMEICDVLLVNSVADGMNLVAKEWAVVSRRPGALIVSETAGVAGEVEDVALLISPLDIEGTARAMACGLEMPTAERAARLATIRARVERWTASRWLDAQLDALGVARTAGRGRAATT